MTDIVRMRFRLFVLLALLLMLQACSSIPVEQRADRRAKIYSEAQDAIGKLIEQDPSIATRLENATGYFVARVSAAHVAVLGGAQGIGMLVENQTGDRTYLNVRRFDVGAGLGVRYFSILMIIDSQEQFEAMRRGRTFRGLASNVAAGQRSGDSLLQTEDGITFHFLDDSSANVAATARRVRLSVNHDLTDTGLSEISIPNIGFNIEDGHDETERRWWDHKMPFMAQKVIDLGYDLPLPYGFKLSYVNVDQDQVLTNLYVGFNGSQKEYLDWVDFDNASSKSDSVQLIYDTWVFPFLNVFAILGHVDGEAPVDVLIDGNGMLDQLEIDCSRPGNLAACKILQDQNFLLPITAKFSGKNYGIGLNLAGGWKGFFFTLPMSWVRADMDNTNTNGPVISASPRAGKVFKLGDKGNLSLYAGGSYLKSDLHVDGVFPVEALDLTIDYEIDQENKDKWNLVLGFNWDINRHWAIQAEYNGFIGSRETWMGSATWRF